jgi:hypothetical protein
LHNNHDGTFTDVTHEAGVANERWGFGVAVGDYDNDGWPDIYLTDSVLYGGRRRDVALQAPRHRLIQPQIGPYLLAGPRQQCGYLHCAAVGQCRPQSADHRLSQRLLDLTTEELLCVHYFVLPSMAQAYTV